MEVKKSEYFNINTAPLKFAKFATVTRETPSPSLYMSWPDCNLINAVFDSQFFSVLQYNRKRGWCLFTHSPLLLLSTRNSVMDLRLGFFCSLSFLQAIPLSLIFLYGVSWIGVLCLCSSSFVRFIGCSSSCVFFFFNFFIPCLLTNKVKENEIIQFCVFFFFNFFIYPVCLPIKLKRMK